MRSKPNDIIYQTPTGQINLSSLHRIAVSSLDSCEFDMQGINGLMACVEELIRLQGLPEKPSHNEYRVCGGVVKGEILITEEVLQIMEPPPVIMDFDDLEEEV